MIDLKDFKNYFKDNYQFLLTMKKKWRILFSSFDDVVVILQLIEDQIESKIPLTEELETVFGVAFNYLYEQLEFVKLVYNRYLNKNDKLLKKYEKLVAYSIYLYDIEDTLKEKNKLTDEIEDALGAVQKDIENILEHNKEYSDEVLDKYNDLIDPHIGDKRVYSSLEIFAMIRDEIKIG